MVTSLTLLWPGYFAQPEPAPAIPPGTRASMAGYVGTFVSMSEHLADGSLAGALRHLRMPAIFLPGAQSPMPISQGKQASALLPGSEVVIVPALGHCPGTSSPAAWPARCPGSAAWRAIWSPPDNGIQPRRQAVPACLASVSLVTMRDCS